MHELVIDWKVVKVALISTDESYALNDQKRKLNLYLLDFSLSLCIICFTQYQ